MEVGPQCGFRGEFVVKLAGQAVLLPLGKIHHQDTCTEYGYGVQSIVFTSETPVEMLCTFCVVSAAHCGVAG